MSRIYVSSSWKNELQPDLVTLLRQHGHKVYDFRHPDGRDDRNVWEEVTPPLHLNTAYQQSILTPPDYDKMLSQKAVRDRFNDHFNAMSDADTCVLLLPCGRSSHVEAGYMAGVGKRVFVYDTSTHITPELMYLTFDGYFHTEEDLLEALNEPIPGVCRVCGCTESNPCYTPDHGHCWWVEPSLCSHCAELCDDPHEDPRNHPELEHCINDRSNAFK